ncbi:hypothetical protein J3F83DRAFT_470714 [Trichoderma novae-zelandiae]
MCDQGAACRRAEQSGRIFASDSLYCSPSPPLPPRFRLSCLSLPTCGLVAVFSLSFPLPFRACVCLRLDLPRRRRSRSTDRPSIPLFWWLALPLFSLSLRLCCVLACVCTVESCRSLFFFSSASSAAASGTIAVDTYTSGTRPLTSRPLPFFAVESSLLPLCLIHGLAHLATSR